MTLRRLPLLAVLALAAAPASAAAAPAARVDIPAAAATPPAGARVVGSATDSVDVLVGLRRRDRAGLQAFVAQVSDPRSPAYGHYLTAAQFRARYAPAQSAVDAVRAFATANGLRVASVPANHAFVELVGSAAAAERAFATRLQAVRVDGRLAHLPAGTPSVPASLGGIVTTIEGLDTSRVVKPMAQTYPDAFVNAGPCSSYYGEKVASDVPGAYGTAHFPWAPCGYVPGQLRSAYGLTDVVARGIDGRGVKVGIIDAFDYPHAQQDANTYAGRHGELALASYTDNSPAGLDQVPEAGLSDPNGWAGEQQLDVEAVHAIAPRAQIVYHGAASAFNVAFTQAQNAVVDNQEAQIVSNSYGGSEDDSDANTEAVLQQAAATGIGFYFSSGDEGDETQDPNGPGDREVDSSANQPMATGVGGTSLAVGSDGGYQFETGWGTYSATLTAGAFDAPGDFNSGGGGGTSQVYGQPGYQAGVVPDAISRFFAGKPPENSQAADFPPIVPGRAVPDVAMVADPNTGMLVGQTEDFDATRNGQNLPTDTDVHYGEYRIGGTSLSSPLFAGVMALADQAAGHAHGFANPALYGLAGTDAFHDVVSPASTLAVIRNDFRNSLDASGGIDTKLRSLNQTNTIHTIPGYDDVTGLGSPRGPALLHALAPGNATLTALTSPPAQPAPAAPAAPAPSPATPRRCARHRITIRLRHHRHDAIRTVVIRLAGHKRRVLHGRDVRRFTLRTTARTRRLTVTTTTRRGLRITTVRKVGTCGLIGHARQVSRRHVS